MSLSFRLGPAIVLLDEFSAMREREGVKPTALRASDGSP
jgi:hypothetical protein